MAALLAFEGVSKSFPAGWGRRRAALGDFSAVVEPGARIGLVGPNGAGKSTCLRLAAGLLRPDVGRCLLRGLPCSARAARQRLGYAPELPQLPPFLTAREFLALTQRLAGAKVDLDAALATVGLADAADRAIRGYSKGMRMRLSLAQALAHAPELLLLDEPTGGLDALGAAGLARELERLHAAGATYLLCSHRLDWLAPLCETIWFLRDGRLIEVLPLARESDPVSAVHARFVEHFAGHAGADAFAAVI